MATTVHKQVLGRPSSLSIRLHIPQYAEFLHVGLQDHQICLWYRCNPDEPLVIRTFYVVGTGWLIHSIPDAYHIGTLQEDLPDGQFVWHVFVDYLEE